MVDAGRQDRCAGSGSCDEADGSGSCDEADAAVVDSRGWTLALAPNKKSGLCRVQNADEPLLGMVQNHRLLVLEHHHVANGPPLDFQQKILLREIERRELPLGIVHGAGEVCAVWLGRCGG